MPLKMKLTYFALKPTDVDGIHREPGDLVPEAANWPYLSGYLTDMRIAPVLVATLPKAGRDALELWEYAQEHPEEFTDAETADLTDGATDDQQQDDGATPTGVPATDPASGDNGTQEDNSSDENTGSGTAPVTNEKEKANV